MTEIKPNIGVLDRNSIRSQFIRLQDLIDTAQPIILKVNNRFY